jgi:hypothetical protein
MSGKDMSVVVVHVVAGIQQHLLFEKKQRRKVCDGNTSKPSICI